MFVTSLAASIEADQL